MWFNFDLRRQLLLKLWLFHFSLFHNPSTFLQLSSISSAIMSFLAFLHLNLNLIYCSDLKEGFTLQRSNNNQALGCCQIYRTLSVAWQQRLSGWFNRHWRLGEERKRLNDRKQGKVGEVTRKTADGREEGNQNFKKQSHSQKEWLITEQKTHNEIKLKLSLPLNDS